MNGELSGCLQKAATTDHNHNECHEGSENGKRISPRIHHRPMPDTALVMLHLHSDSVLITANVQGHFQQYDHGTKVSYNTVDSYFETLQDCFFVYKADRYDVVGKEYLKLINKYYVTDFGFKYYILNNKTVELSQILENLVFLELKRRRFKVATGKVAEKEVDFIIKDNQDAIKYVQVAVTVMDEAKLQQELRPFNDIDDHYPKYVITLDDFFVKDHDGITTINAIDFLLGQEI